jgi:hypothetical protein
MSLTKEDKEKFNKGLDVWLQDAKEKEKERKDKLKKMKWRRKK